MPTFRWIQWNLDKIEMHNVTEAEAEYVASSMERKVLDPKLPGRFGRMTAEELDAEVAEYDRPFVAERRSRPLSANERAQYQHALNRGRAKNVRRPKRAQISIDGTLLKRADAYAKRHGMTRSELIARGLEAMIGSAA